MTEIRFHLKTDPHGYLSNFYKLPEPMTQAVVVAVFCLTLPKEQSVGMSDFGIGVPVARGCYCQRDGPDGGRSDRQLSHPSGDLARRAAFRRSCKPCVLRWLGFLCCSGPAEWKWATRDPGFPIE